MQIKTFLNNTAFAFRPKDALDTIRKHLAFTPLESVAMLQARWIALGDGIFEYLHLASMQIPPQFNVSDLPARIA